MKPCNSTIYIINCKDILLNKKYVEIIENSPYFKLKAIKLVKIKDVSYHHYLEKMEMLKTTSLFLYFLIGNNDYQIKVDEFGKIYISEFDNISITNSYPIISIATNKNYDIGIDIEFKNREDELLDKLCFYNENQKYNLNSLKIWTIKEAIYKCYSSTRYDFRSKVIKLDENLFSFQNNKAHISFIDESDYIICIACKLDCKIIIKKINLKNIENELK